MTLNLFILFVLSVPDKYISVLLFQDSIPQWSSAPLGFSTQFYANSLLSSPHHRLPLPDSALLTPHCLFYLPGYHKHLFCIDALRIRQNASVGLINISPPPGLAVDFPGDFPKVVALLYHIAASVKGRSCTGG